MTDQSRVEAVADALLLCSKMQIDLGKADLMQMAQAAIEANDDWLKARTHRLAAVLKHRLADSCELIGGWSPMRIAQVAIDELGAQSPEESDR